MAKATTKAASRSAAQAKKSAAKKAVTSKTSGNSSSAKTGKANSSKGTKGKADLGKFEQSQLELLREERATYVRQAESLKAEADSLTEDREPGDVQFDEESGEGDTLAVERERDLALSAQARAAVEDIDLAIEKIYDGTYGQCTTCGKAIPKERLKALPHAALCVQCKSGGLGLRR